MVFRLVRHGLLQEEPAPRSCWAFRGVVAGASGRQLGLLRPALPVGLALLSQTEHSVDWSFLMAGSTLASLPVLAVFVAFQRQILSGLLAGAEK